jgi:1-acyl-sn-glycerol-3-phosphate acyltransferase
MRVWLAVPIAVVVSFVMAEAVDILLVFGYLPVDIRIIHKRSLHWIPLIGWSLWAAGHIGIDRKNPFRARRSLAAAARRIRRGTSVTVFPEGTRSGDGSVGLFKRGSFLLAINAAAAVVVPVSLAGVVRVAPSGLLSLRPGCVAVRLHPPVQTAGRAPDQAERLAAQVRQRVITGLEEAT